MIYRELKFRRHSDYENEFLYYDLRSSNEDEKLIFDKSSNYPIEQYTGINDKNRKEIYEGDIIQENLSFDNEAVDGIFKYKVYWNENELCWSLEHIGNESIHDDLWECNSSIEIIGNIYDNPELLKG